MGTKAPNQCQCRAEKEKVVHVDSGARSLLSCSPLDANSSCVCPLIVDLAKTDGDLKFYELPLVKFGENPTYKVLS